VTSPGVSVTPIPYDSVNATLQVSVSAAVAPTVYNLWLIDARFVDHARRVRVNVVSTAQSTAGAVDAFTAAGLIHPGVAGALTAKLNAAQSRIDASQTQPAVNTLAAFIKQVDAQSGKQIATSGTHDGVEFNPAAVLIAQARSVIAYLTIDGSAAPLMGYVVSSTRSAIHGATVAIFDASNTAVATATTDATGFYFLPTTDAWSAGSTYVAKVIGLPAGFTTATPAWQAFTWEGGAGMLENFVLNK
jgi:FIMAH domain-containing protein